MKILFTVLLFMALVAPSAYGRLTLLPSDDTAGGGAGDIYWFMHFGSNATAWPSTDSCLRNAGGASHRPCSTGAAPDSLNVKAYFGTPFIRYLACSPSVDHTLWGSAATLSISLYEVQGSDTEGNLVQNKLGGAITFDQTDGAGVAKRLIINTTTTLSGGQIQVRFSAVSAAPSAPVDNGLTCVIALAE